MKRFRFHSLAQMQPQSHLSHLLTAKTQRTARPPGFSWRFWRLGSENPPLWAALATGLLALGVYLLTLAPDLTSAYFGGDGGELITAAVTRGIPHPPGYPTYLLLAKLFSYLPLGTVAFRFNLFSAVCSAAAAALLAAAAASLTRQDKPYAAVAAGLTFALTPLVWQQALITEVYGLNLLATAALLWTILTGRAAIWRGICLGLCLTTHLTSLLLLPLTLLFTPPRAWLKLVFGLLVGLLPYLWLPWWLHPDSPVVWGDPTTLEGWWWLVSGRIYQPNLAHFDQIGLRLASWLAALARQYAWWGWGLLAVGLWRRDRLALALAASAALYGLYALTYAAADAAVFFLPGLLLLSVLLAFTPPSWAAPSWGRVCLILPLTLLALNFDRVSLHSSASLRLTAQPTLTAAPPRAILLTMGDESIFTLWYFQAVERAGGGHQARSDVILVDANLFAFDWYRRRLSRLHPDLPSLNRDDLTIFSSQTQRPFCVVGPAARSLRNCVNDDPD